MEQDPIRTYLLTRWPAYYAFMAGSLIAGLVIIVVGGVFGWWWLVASAALALLAVNYLLAASLWLARQMQDMVGMSASVWELGQLDPDERLAAIDLGLRQLTLRLRARLRKGRILAIDVYNPQMTPAPRLARLRAREFEWADTYQADPRLESLPGALDLLPLPDEHVSAVVLAQLLTELAQSGDRVQLLREVYRILAPGGRFIVIEPVRQAEAWWAYPVLGGLDSAESWHALFHMTGFQLHQTGPVNPLLYAFVWRKPGLSAPGQLRFKFAADPSPTPAPRSPFPTR